MCDVHFKFEEARTKTAVAIESNRYLGQTDRQTDIHSSDFISVNAMNCIGQTMTNMK